MLSPQLINPHRTGLKTCDKCKQQCRLKMYECCIAPKNLNATTFTWPSVPTSLDLLVNFVMFELFVNLIFSENSPLSQLFSTISLPTMKCLLTFSHSLVNQLRIHSRITQLICKECVIGHFWALALQGFPRRSSMPSLEPRRALTGRALLGAPVLPSLPYSPTSASPWLDSPRHFFHFVIVIFAPV